MVVCVFSFRYDAHLVPGLIENISPFVHAYVACDDRDANDTYTSEPPRRNALLARAREMGADWILVADPDERFEAATASRMSDLVGGRQDTLWSFDIREMFTAESYRVDGLWGGKTRICLFPAAAAIGNQTAALHGGWVEPGPRMQKRAAGLNLYHLRMATPERRRHRRETYAAVDPDRLYQRGGYDYLDDERGMVLQRIPEGRGFRPAFVEDGGLWAPLPEQLGPVKRDPDLARLTYAQVMRRRRGAAAALFTLRDMMAEAPEDTDLAQFAARLALEARDADAAEAICGGILSADPQAAHALITQSQARLMRGDRTGAAAAVRAAHGIVPDSAWVGHLAHSLETATARFAQPDAAWRHWVAGPAAIHEGARVGTGDLATVIIGYRAPSELVGAVVSVRSQSRDVEIVVVNSGGGPVREVLREHLDHIRLVEIQERLFVGAARNVGIDASNSPFVAFLAADCRAKPGWVEGRLAHHRAGAMSVASAVVPEKPGNLSSAACAFIHHRRRHPRTPEAEALLYGQSSARVLFSMVGYFPPGMYLGEDTAFNDAAARSFAPVWAPDVVMTHRYPTRPFALLRDMHRRGHRRLIYVPQIVGTIGPDFAESVRSQAELGLRNAKAAVRRLGRFDPLRRAIIEHYQERAVEADFRGLRKAARKVEAAQLAANQAQARLETDPAGAVGLAERAVALIPQSWQFNLLLGRALCAADPERNLDHALVAFRRAVALAPHEDGPAEALHEALSRAGRHAEALAEAERAVILAPTIKKHHENAARSALALGRLNLARLHGHANLIARPYSIQAHAFLGRVDLALGLSNQMKARRRMRNEFAARLQLLTGQ